MGVRVSGHSGKDAPQLYIWFMELAESRTFACLERLHDLWRRLRIWGRR